MKHIILFLCLSLTCGNVTAKDESQSILSDSELQTAKTLFLKMMETRTYKLFAKKNNDFTQKLNGLDIFTIQDYDAWMEGKSEDKSVDGYLTNKLANNLTRTHFKSVEEGVEDYKAIMELEQRKMAENPELYELLKRASAAQSIEIKKPELMALYDEKGSK